MRFLVLLFAFLGGERLQPGHAPTPFTAEQIRAACPDGRVSTFLIDDKTRMVFRFARGDAEGVDVEQEMGERLTVARATWTSLQRHASYPEADTTITEETIATPLGQLACKVYAVGKGAETVRYYFAVSIPGPPVKIVSKQVNLTMIEHRPFDYAQYFGPQEADGGVDKELAAQSAVRVNVVKGKELLRMDTDTATVFAGQVRKGITRTIDPGTFYVVARFKGPDAQCVVRVKDGLLRGALIPMGIYPLPAGVKVPAGKLAFEIAALK